jgi:Arc/MetJ family transcription regulator
MLDRVPVETRRDVHLARRVLVRARAVRHDAERSHSAMNLTELADEVVQ